MSVLKVASWNLNSGVLGNAGSRSFSKSKVSKCLQSSITQLGIDVIVMQEFPIPFSNPEEFISVIRRNTQLSHVHYVAYANSHLVDGLRLGLVIASSAPLYEIDSATLNAPDIIIESDNLEPQKLHPRALIHAKTKFHDLSVSIATLHLPPFRAIRRDPGEKIFDEMRTAVENYTANLSDSFIIAGDMNTSSLDHFITGFGKKYRCTDAISLPTRDDGVKTDCVYISTNLQATNAQVLRSVSDHFVCVCDVSGRDATAFLDTRYTRAPAALRDCYRIVHLSDLHFGPGESQDVDWKNFIAHAERESRSQRLKGYLRALEKAPDYVICSGDFTIAGKEEGLKAARDMLLELIQEERLPARNCIVAVPGNHDVVRRPSSGKSDELRWTLFNKYVGDAFVRPLMAGDSDLETIVRRIEMQVRNETSLIGGVESAIDPRTGQRRQLNFPFLLDRKKHLLIYAFNSASVSGSEIVFSPDAEQAIESLRSKISSMAADERLAVEKLFSLKFVDAARINPSEINLFRLVMDSCRKLLGPELSTCFKIAVLHHHISTIFGEEVKNFETTLNAGKLKKELSSEGFNLVCHGHKHWQEVFLDSAITGGQSIYVASGSTIGGVPSKGDPGFYVFDVYHERGEVFVYFVPIQDDNPTNVVSRAFDNPQFTFRYWKEERASTALVEAVDLPSILCRVKKRLNSTVRPGRDSGCVGWNNFLPHEEPTTLGTAYAVAIYAEIGDDAEPFTALRRHIGNYLSSRRRKNGAWSASSSGEPGQPLETSIVLNALARCIDPGAFEDELSRFETYLDELPDSCLTSNYLCASILQTLMRYRPASRHVQKLVDRLRCAEITLPGNGARGWGERNSVWPDLAVNLDSFRISVPHTAFILGVVSRNENGRVFDRDISEYQSTVEWMLISPWDPRVEKIQQLGGKELIVNYYTQAICSYALMQLGVACSHPRIAAFIQDLVASEQQGAWSGPQAGVTTWATLDAVKAAKAAMNSIFQAQAQRLR